MVKLILFGVGAAVITLIVHRLHDGRWRRHRDHTITFLQILIVGFVALALCFPYVARDVSVPVPRWALDQSMPSSSIASSAARRATLGCPAAVPASGKRPLQVAYIR
jgi:hypothetical protein